MHRTILVPLDGSAGSEAVLAPVGDLARLERATLRLLHVAPPVKARLDGDGRVVAYADQETSRVRHEARAYLVSAAAALAGLEVELTVRFGDPVEEIVREAERGKADLIAMATHRRAGLRRLLEGSVAERVARAARVPMLLVGYRERLAVGVPAWALTVRRRFWCAWSGREVEVEFVRAGLPGRRSVMTVKRCSAFDPPTAIACRRRCVDPAFRRQWEPSWPVPR